MAKRNHTISLPIEVSDALIQLQNDRKINVSQLCADAIRERIAELNGIAKPKYKPWPSLVYSLREITKAVEMVTKAPNYMADVSREIDAIEAWHYNQ